MPRRLAPSLALLALAGTALVAAPIPAAGAGVVITATRPVLANGGGQPNGEVADAVMTPDGKWLAFSTDATNIVADDDNDRADVFVQNLETDAVTRLVPPSGDPADADSYSPTICDDGSVIAFTTDSDLFADDLSDTNFASDVYVYLRDIDSDGVLDEPGTTAFQRMSVDSDGVEAQFGGYSGAISGDCKWVAFVTGDPFANSDGNDADDVYVRDVAATKTVRITPGVNSAGGGGLLPSISETGRFVAFQSYATDIADGGGGFKFGTYLRDRDADNDGVFDEGGAATTDEYINKSTAGLVSTGGPDTAGPAAITPDGSCVAFKFYNGFALTTDAPQQGVFVRNRTAGTTVLASKNALGLAPIEVSRPAISPDCRYVTFDSSDNDVVSGDTNPARDVMIRDLQSGTLKILSTATAGAAADQASYNRQVFGANTGLIISSASNIGGANGGSALRDPFVLGAPGGDTTPPALKTSVLSAAEGWVLGTTSGFTGGATDESSTLVAVERKVAPYNDRFPTDWTGVAANSGTNVTVTATGPIGEGQSVCYRQSAVDSAGNTAGPTAPLCEARPLTARRLTAGSKWTAVADARFYGGRALVTSTLGAKAAIEGVQTQRIALVATKCRGCGSVSVTYAGVTRVVSLDSTVTRYQQLVDVMRFDRTQTGPVVIAVTTSGKPVRIEGLGLRKRPLR